MASIKTEVKVEVCETSLPQGEPFHNCLQTYPSYCTSDLERCEGLWYADGTVVLQAGSMIFRVYAGLLRQYSTKFTAMLRAAEESGDVYEGRPILRLDDKGEDVRAELYK